ncbi:MAG: MBL fold metallo-hydrolase [Phycisphaerae bacterium]
MLTFSLQSGSNGNAIYVEAGGVRLLFDCGISAKLAAERMAARGRDLRDLDALVVSHEHIDHVLGAGVVHRRYGTPVFMSYGTQRGARESLGELRRATLFGAGERIEFGPVRVQTFRTPHDALEPVCFVVEFEGRRLGILTDLGTPTRRLAELVETLDAAYLESNYDAEMLAGGPYTPDLKRRIRGGRGHLSNGESAVLAARGAARRLRWVAAAHLSAVNNTSELALAAHRAGVGSSFPVVVASRDAVGEVLEL